MGSKRPSWLHHLTVACGVAMRCRFALRSSHNGELLNPEECSAGKTAFYYSACIQGCKPTSANANHSCSGIYLQCVHELKDNRIYVVHLVPNINAPEAWHSPLGLLQSVEEVAPR